MSTPMRWEPNTNETCTICLNSDNNDRATLPCNHSFHCDCISQWAITCLDRGDNVTCPNCRAPITGDDEFISALVANDY